MFFNETNGLNCYKLDLQLGIKSSPKVKYTEHVMKDNAYKWSKVMTTWVLHIGKCGGGRPRTRRTDKIKSNDSCMRKVKNRLERKDLVSTYA